MQIQDLQQSALRVQQALTAWREQQTQLIVLRDTTVRITVQSQCHVLSEHTGQPQEQPVSMIALSVIQDMLVAKLP